jgi:hypothetical protein
MDRGIEVPCILKELTSNTIAGKVLDAKRWAQDGHRKENKKEGLGVKAAEPFNEEMPPTRLERAT